MLIWTVGKSVSTVNLFDSTLGWKRLSTWIPQHAALAASHCELENHLAFYFNLLLIVYFLYSIKVTVFHRSLVCLFCHSFYYRMSATALVRSTIRSNALQLSREKKFNNLNGTRQELLEKIGLTFNEFGGLVVGYVDIENYITLFLSQSGVQSAVTTPTNSTMMVSHG